MTAYSQDFIKDPLAIKDYTVNASDWLGTDTIASYAWTIPTGMTKLTDSNTSTTLTVWLSGGSFGSDYECSVLFTTTGGRTERVVLRIQVC